MIPDGKLESWKNVVLNLKASILGDDDEKCERIAKWLDDIRHTHMNTSTLFMVRLFNQEKD